MSERGWKTAHLRDIPSVGDLPGVDTDAYLQRMTDRAPHILQRWAAAQERYDGENRRTHAVRMFLGIESFGVNAFEAHEGELLVIPHDELGEGERQEELYLVVQGRARFVCEGEEVDLGPGE